MVETRVNITGSTFCSLLYELASSQNDQLGFLLGTCNKHSTNVISDSQFTNKKEELVIDLFSHFPSSNPCKSFYNTKGNVDQVELLRMLGEKYKHVIGWYSFHRNTSLGFSLRERAIHQSLLKVFGGTHQGTFLCIKFTSRLSPFRKCQTLEYNCFSTKNTTVLEKLPLAVLNLGDTVHSQYQHATAASSSQGATGGILHSFRSRLCDCAGKLRNVLDIQELNCAMLEHLAAINEKVVRSEDALKQLEGEVAALRGTLREKKDKLRLEQKNSTKDRLLNANSVPEMRSTDLLAVQGGHQAGESQEAEVGAAANTDTTPSTDSFASLVMQAKDSIQKTPPHQRGAPKAGAGQGWVRGQVSGGEGGETAARPGEDEAPPMDYDQHRDSDSPKL